MSTLDTAALRALADAATPGPWSVSTLSPHIIYSETDCRPVAVVVNGETPWFNEADAELIAALHPDTVRALCDAADEVERWRSGQRVRVLPVLPEHPDALNLAAELLRKQTGEYEATDAAMRTAAMALRDVDQIARQGRAAHAALIADLRALRPVQHVCSDGVWLRYADVRDLADRHAPTTGATP